MNIYLFIILLVALYLYVYLNPSNSDLERVLNIVFVKSPVIGALHFHCAFCICWSATCYVKGIQNFWTVILFGSAEESVILSTMVPTMRYDFLLECILEQPQFEFVLWHLYFLSLLG